MRVLVTGAGGNLGRVVAPALAAAGHVPVLFDVRPLDVPYESVVGDVRRPEDVRSAVEGVDAVVHAAALHGIHLGRWTEQDFWDVNVAGTFGVYQAVRAAGVDRVVLCSTMGVYGAVAPPAGWGAVTDGDPLAPRDVYGLTKVLCEELGRYHARTSGIRTRSLRLGMFVPETFERYGFRLLFGGVDDRDVAQAVLLALGDAGGQDFESVNVFADVPFTDADLTDLARDPAAVLERYWPGTSQLVAERRLDLDELMWGRHVWRIDRARQRLGYSPRYGFAEFLDALRRDDRGHYPFAGLPWWGVD